MARQFAIAGYLGAIGFALGVVLALTKGSDESFVPVFAGIGTGAWLAAMGYWLSRKVRRALDALPAQGHDTESPQ